MEGVNLRSKIGLPALPSFPPHLLVLKNYQKDEFFCEFPPPSPMSKGPISEESFSCSSPTSFFSPRRKKTCYICMLVPKRAPFSLCTYLAHTLSPHLSRPFEHLPEWSNFLSSPFLFYRCKCKFETGKKSETSKAKREKDRSTFLFFGGERETYISAIKGSVEQNSNIWITGRIIVICVLK